MMSLLYRHIIMYSIYRQYIPMHQHWHACIWSMSMCNDWYACTWRVYEWYNSSFECQAINEGFQHRRIQTGGERSGRTGGVGRITQCWYQHESCAAVHVLVMWRHVMCCVVGVIMAMERTKGYGHGHMDYGRRRFHGNDILIGYCKWTAPHYRYHMWLWYDNDNDMMIYATCVYAYGIND